MRHAKRALLVLLTDFVDAETAAEMVAALCYAARRHVVLYVALKDPFLERASRAVPSDDVNTRTTILARNQLIGFQLDSTIA